MNRLLAMLICSAVFLNPAVPRRGEAAVPGELDEFINNNVLEYGDYKKADYYNFQLGLKEDILRLRLPLGLLYIEPSVFAHAPFSGFNSAAGLRSVFPEQFSSGTGIEAGLRLREVPVSLLETVFTLGLAALYVSGNLGNGDSSHDSSGSHDIVFLPSGTERSRGKYESYTDVYLYGGLYYDLKDLAANSVPAGNVSAKKIGIKFINIQRISKDVWDLKKYYMSKNPGNNGWLFEHWETENSKWDIFDFQGRLFDKIWDFPLDLFIRCRNGVYNTGAPDGYSGMSYAFGTALCIEKPAYRLNIRFGYFDEVRNYDEPIDFVDTIGEFIDINYSF